MPDKWKFEKAKHERRHKKAEKKVVLPKKQEEKEEKSEEEKKDEKAKGQAVADVREKQAEVQTKAGKHVSKDKSPKVQPRLALKK